MILLRRQILKWNIHNPHNQSYQHSLIKKKGLKINQQLSNPFKTRTYSQINNILSMHISNKNQSIFYYFVLQTLQSRIEKQQYVQYAAKQKKIIQELINKTFDKVISEYNDKLSLQDIYLLFDIYYKIKLYRYCQIRQTIRNKINNVQANLQVLLQADNRGQNIQIFKKILYLMLFYKKKTLTTKKLIEYLTKFSLRNSQELIEIFQKFSYLNNSGYYDQMIWPLFTRFFYINQKVQDSLWVKPIVLQIITIYSQNLRIEGNKYLDIIIEAIQYQISQQKMTTRDKVLFLKQLFVICQLSGPFYIILQDAQRIVKLIYAIFQSIQQQLIKNNDFDIENCSIFIKIYARLQDYAEIAHNMLGKSQKQLVVQLSNIIYRAFEYSYINKYPNLTQHHLLELTNQNIKLPKKTKQKLIKSMIKTLQKQINIQDNYVRKIRLLEYIVKQIKDQQVNIDKMQLINILHIFENYSKLLRIYQVIRLYNIFRTLDIKSQVFQQYYNHIYPKNLLNIIQNMSRTVLRKYSYTIINQTLQHLKQTIKSNKIFDKLTVSQIVWFIFKSVDNQNIQQNRDKYFVDLFNKNQQLFRQLSQNVQNCKILISKSITQFSFKGNAVYHSILYQVIFQFMKSCRESVTNTKQMDKEQRFFITHLKIYLETQQIRMIILKKYRYSFFIKIMWALYKLSANQQIQNHYYKKMRSTKQLLLISKQQKLALYRQKTNIRSLIVLKNIQYINLMQQFKLKLHNNILSTWLWCKYHGYTWNIKEYQKKGVWVIQNFVKLIKNYDYNMYVQYIVQNGQINSQTTNEVIQFFFMNTSIPECLYKGTLAPQIQLKSEQILQLTMYTKIMNYIFRKYPHICDIFVQKIMRIQNTLANLVNSFKQLLTLATRQKFTSWLRTILLNTFNPIQNLSTIHVFLQFNLITPQTKTIIHNYINQQLSKANFNIVPLLYINGYTGIQQSISQFIYFFNGNRVLIFMQQIFRTPYLLLMNSILGLVLNQKQQKLLNQYFSILVNEKVLYKIISTVFKQKTQVVYQFKILLQVAKNRLPQSSKCYEIVQRILNQFCTNYPTIPSDIFEHITKQTRKILKLYKIQLPIDQKTKLPIFNKKKLILHNEQVGYIQLVIQYLKVYCNIEDIAYKQIDQLLSEMLENQSKVKQIK